MSAKLDLTGQKYGRLTAVKDCGRNSRGLVLWLCNCDCGKTKVVNSHYLRGGNVQSCGCLKTEGRGTHRMSYSSEHEAWTGMKQRCLCPTNKRFPLYGARGIKVCERWLQFENFLADMGQKPTPQHTLDRIDTNGNYEPSNCRWADSKTQQNNRRNNRFLEFNGQKLTCSQWAEKMGISSDLLRQRIDRDGWSIAQALGGAA